MKSRCFVFLTALLFLIPQASFGEVIERIVAIINDEIVTLTDVDKYADKIKAGGLTDDLLIPNDAAKQDLLKDKKKLLQTMIDEKIIDSEVKRQKLEVPIERVEQEVRSIAKRNDISRDDLKRAVEEKGIRFSQYQDFIKSGLERHALIDRAILSKIKISEDDVMAEYAKVHGDAADQNFEFTIAHILFLTEKGGLKSAQDRAALVLGKLKTGEDFDRIASEYSEDPNFSSGGLLGTFKAGEFSKELEIVVQKMTVGDTSRAIQTKAGLHILKLTKKKLIPDPKIEKAKDEMRGRLYDKAYKKQFQGWLEQVRNEAFIRVN